MRMFAARDGSYCNEKYDSQVAAHEVLRIVQSV